MPKITKAEAAEILECDERTVERLSKAKKEGERAPLSVELVPGKTRRVPMYDEAEVRALAEARKQPQPRQLPALEIATSGDTLAAPLSPLVAILQRTISEPIIAALREAQSAPPAPSVWLTLDAAAAWLGLPRRQIEKVLREDRERKDAPRRIRVNGAGRWLRVHAADARAYFES